MDESSKETSSDSYYLYEKNTKVHCKYIIFIFITYKVIDNIYYAKSELYKILANNNPVIAVDCEGINEMSRFGKLSLLQVS